MMIRNLAVFVLVAILLLCGCSTSPGKHVPRSSTMFDLSKYKSVQTREGQNGDVTVVVAISGGGYRAANLGVGALLALEDIQVEYDGKKSNLLKEVDYFTTVSGGGLAAGTYVQWLLSSAGSPSGSFKQYVMEEPVNRYGVSTNISALQKTLAWRILGYNFSPKTYGDLDRGDLLQTRMDRTVLRKDCDVGTNDEFCSWVLGDVFRAPGDTTKPVSPYWIANATNYVNGEIFSFTPDNICSQQIAGYSHRLRWGQKMRVVECESGLAMNIPLALGMRSSANFPVGIPATTMWISETDSIKLSDGGQADNLAFYSALEILFQEAEKSAYMDESGQLPRSHRRLLVIIDAFRGALGNSHEEVGAPDMLSAALRSPNLPLDALRSRIKASVSMSGGGRRSEVDSVILGSNLAVAYISIDDEDEAREVGTTFWLDESEQRALIEAGYRQARAVLANECGDLGFPRSEKSVDVDSVKRCAGAMQRGTLEFNAGIANQRREDLSNELSVRLSALAQTASELEVAIQSSVDDDWRVRQAELERKHYSNELEDNQRRDESRAYEAALGELQGGVVLRSTIRRYEEILDNVSTDNSHRDVVIQGVSELACDTLQVLAAIRSPYDLAHPFRCTRKNVLVGKGAGQRLVSLEAMAHELPKKCRKVGLKATCESLDAFVRQALSASAVYYQNLRPIADLMPEVPAVFAKRAECRSVGVFYDLSKAVSEQSESVDQLSSARYRDSQIEENRILDSVKRVREVLATVPRTVPDIAAGCDVDPEQVALRVGPAFDRMKLSISDVNCLLDEFPEAWPATNDRVKVLASQVFDSRVKEPICGASITAIPNAFGSKMGAVQASK